MSKQIYVQAQADHIASLAKAAPISALEELVWNALDADAREVRIDLIQNSLGAVEAIRVADNGTGIDVLKVDATFGSLGGSWKRLGTETAEAHRRLHGRHGRGRFKAFALGTQVEWRTTIRVGGELFSYVLKGEAERPGVFEMESLRSPGPGTGTEVYISNARVTCDSLLDAAQTVQALAAKFALYLKSYPDVRIYLNGLPVTPIIVQRKVTDYTLEVLGHPAKLEVIEWKTKFVGAGRLVFCGSDGFEVYDVAAGIRSGGEPFTAYLVGERISALAREGALMMDELNPEVRAYLDAARAQLKTHFAAEVDENIKAFKKEWKTRLATFTEKEQKVLYLLLKKSLTARLTVAGERKI